MLGNLLSLRKETIANIMSFINVQKKYSVTYDSSMKTRFIIHRGESTNYELIPSSKGLFFSDVISDIVLANTVVKIKYTVKD